MVKAIVRTHARCVGSNHHSDQEYSKVLLILATYTRDDPDHQNIFGSYMYIKNG